MSDPRDSRSSSGPAPDRARAGVGSSGPLSGLLVADFSRILAGPYATMLLGDLGADVVKVESPGGDDTRTWLPPTRGDVATYYLAINRNKRSVTLDFADPEDRALAHELAARADVVIENFKPGGLRKFGLDYASVAERNPSVVYASISGFGSGGGASLPGYDLIVQAMSGLMSLTGDPDGPPYRAGISVFDVMSGMQATIGILAALQHRSRTGEGQQVEVNLLSTALSGMVNQSSAWVAGGDVPNRMGNAHPSLFPYEPLPTSDGDLIITAGNDGQFRRLCDALGIPEVADEARFAHNQDRNTHREELRPLLVERPRTADPRGVVPRPSPMRASRADRSTRLRRESASRRRSVSTPSSRLARVTRPSPRFAIRSPSRPRLRATCCLRRGWASTTPRSVPG